MATLPVAKIALEDYGQIRIDNGRRFIQISFDQARTMHAVGAEVWWSSSASLQGLARIGALWSGKSAGNPAANFWVRCE